MSLSSAVLGSQRWQSRAGTVGSVGPRQKSPGGGVLLSAGAAADYLFVLFRPGLGETRAQHEKDRNVQRCQQLNIIFIVRERKCRGGSDKAADLSLT